MTGGHFVELGEHGLLDRHALGHSLDHEVDVAERRVIGRPRDQPQPPLELGRLELAGVDPALPQRPGLLQPEVNELLIDVLEDDRNVGVGDRLSDFTTHRAGADHGGFEDEHGA